MVEVLKFEISDVAACEVVADGPKTEAASGFGVTLSRDCTELEVMTFKVVDAELMTRPEEGDADSPAELVTGTSLNVIDDPFVETSAVSLGIEVGAEPDVEADTSSGVAKVADPLVDAVEGVLAALTAIEEDAVKLIRGMVLVLTTSPAGEVCVLLTGTEDDVGSSARSVVEPVLTGVWLEDPGRDPAVDEFELTLDAAPPKAALNVET